MSICLNAVWASGLLVLLTARSALGQWIEEPAWREYFNSAGVTGALLLYDPAVGRYRTSDLARSRAPYIPASTFKIFNALAALEAHVVSTPDEIIPWDGQDRCLAGWNRDLSLRTAFQESAFWVYQRFARRIGASRMVRWLRAAEYGNRRIGGGIDRFWLDGDLRTSLVDQVHFLHRLHERRLPFSPSTIATVEDVMVEERAVDYLLRGKTGWARSLTPAGDRFADCQTAPTQANDPRRQSASEVGWYVGYVQLGDRTVYFALNLDIRRPEDAVARRGIVRRVLQEEGLITAQASELRR
jgi:beta-lactamase class D